PAVGPFARFVSRPRGGFSSRVQAPDRALEPPVPIRPLLSRYPFSGFRLGDKVGKGERASVRSTVRYGKWVSTGARRKGPCVMENLRSSVRATPSPSLLTNEHDPAPERGGCERTSGHGRGGGA